MEAKLISPPTYKYFMYASFMLMLQYWQGKATNYTMFTTAFYLECQWHLRSLWNRTKGIYQNLHYKWVQKVSTYQVSPLECNMKQSGIQVPTFQSNLPPPTSGQKTEVVLLSSLNMLVTAYQFMCKLLLWDYNLDIHFHGNFSLSTST